MTTASRQNEGLLGIAQQTAEGTAKGTATYAHTLYGGLPRPVRADNEMEVASTGQHVPGIFATEQHWEMDATFPGLPISLGQWLLAAFGTLSTSGAGDPYTHTFTPAATPGFITAFGRTPGSLYRKFADGTVNELSFNFEAGQPLRVNAKAMGYTPTDLAVAWTATTTEAYDTDGEYLTMIGSTLKMDIGATPASTTVATIQSGTITVTRDLSLIQTDGFEPEHRSLGLFKVGVSVHALWVDATAFKATYYGSTSGTASSPVQPVSSLDLTFAVGPTTNANHSLQLQVPKVKLAVPEPPDVDPAAGPTFVDLAGMVFAETGDTIITAKLKSSVSTYT